jgi:hypothetical protein
MSGIGGRTPASQWTTSGGRTPVTVAIGTRYAASGYPHLKAVQIGQRAFWSRPGSSSFSQSQDQPAGHTAQGGLLRTGQASRLPRHQTIELNAPSSTIPSAEHSTASSAPHFRAASRTSPSTARSGAFDTRRGEGTVLERVTVSRHRLLTAALPTVYRHRGAAQARADQAGAGRCRRHTTAGSRCRPCGCRPGRSRWSCPRRRPPGSCGRFGQDGLARPA